ncbi:hypothetical protein [Devosia sediminis]|uniref:Uncharacterized protein n=1 Tax=Devosia sediminis TaxID=2798801 RepID=A0A934IW64_9HYPH|nr:hypothetical protein [Devosia sediminis]MBJ3785467.1 hypothetical protein [Devosia sediminis]
MHKALIGAGIVGVGAVAALSALWLAPPLRLVAPTLFGVTCADRICVERANDLPQARALIKAAIDDLEDQIGLAVPELAVVLCRTEACYRGFGGGAERAISFPFLGMLIAGRSWQDYIVRHELIHWLQFEHFGAVETMSYPAWFREGMAYALSDAPAWDVPQPFKPWADQFVTWRGDRTINDMFLQKPVLDAIP